MKMIGQTWNDNYFKRQWNISTCHGEDGTVTKCCLQPGRHTLSCQNIAKFRTLPNGWGNVSLQIQGQEYCNNFFGTTTFRDVLISGKLI